MYSFGRFFASGSSNGARSLLGDEIGPLIHGRRTHGYHSVIPAKDVTKVALKLKYLYVLSRKSTEFYANGKTD